MPRNNTLILLLVVFILAFCLTGNGVYAFGAGNIPSFAYMEGRAFRHGDIEDILSDLVKKGGGGFALGALIGKGGSKFSGLDVKRVYFGNWLRDYSQAVDIAGLSKLQLQTIINLCMALGFMAHGYATGEFEVTAERLGCYLPTEHIDNPKGYGDGQDARQIHPGLRGPVDPMELEIDPRTGMKNYIANENGRWDTSKALVRRTLEKCIHLGRQYRSQGRKDDEYEAFRLLGTALHTLEDFSAHSNFCELALVSMGHHQVFTHVGDQVRVQASNGKWVAPLVTGTFGSSDFIHSLLGEATDHLSEASVSDLNRQLDTARSKSMSTRGPGGSANPADSLRNLLFSLPGGTGGDMSRDMEGIERIRAGSAPGGGGKRPEDMSPQELHAVLWQVLTFRDGVVKNISNTIEKIPGLGPLIEKLMDSISVFVFTTLEPFLKPIIKSASSGLTAASSEVIDNHDQYEVFNDPRASDPTHSFLSKDHFNLILNEPAGRIAQIIVKYAVTEIIKAWDDTSVNVHNVTEDILQCLFHPDFHNSNSRIQREMMQCMHDWVKGLGGKQHQIISRLGKNEVRNHQNTRLAGEGGAPEAQGTYAHAQGIQAQNALQGYIGQIPGVSQVQSIIGGGSGVKRDGPGGGGYPGAGHGPSGGHGAGYSSPPPPMTGQAASYFNDAPASSYPGAGSYAPPSAPPPGGASSYAPPSGPPPPSGNRPQQHSGYNPSYTSPPPSFPGGPPSHHGGHGHHHEHGSDRGPSFPGAPSHGPPGGGPGFPLAPTFPGAGEGHGGYSSYGQPGGFPSPSGPPPGGLGGFGDPYAQPPGGGMGFPGAEPFGAPGGPPPQFPGAPPPGGYSYGAAYRGGASGGGGW
ncbi:hypothetical protein PC9H_008470 [Pleurotus ostreatus]|uniref:Het-C-domain-containing protein n=1 Tax=Pleurotus ostreatus TaxID=5322 RepID=A0A8H7DP01_PLEOS|nr:uncharacterized protein PC9H_008470 [Pleurotus ostreatus]KAF7426104.1 hypothetical protein PC9H_008470 [Pleurotus ostreatus]KAJ8693546.1 hypothetical protein PTI98_008531 [Pleurotus ostreatus]